ncbi:sensor histidine kinase [Alteromonas antoniana]|uniref:sensor histidine kinase n=1 Tax=Alteromonas antoniana TaxID=2803813 RepID=UPI001C48063F|nr:HAMP domain-containing sensor histidine kinase [Alteromonas antoniana]
MWRSSLKSGEGTELSKVRPSLTKRLSILVSIVSIIFISLLFGIAYVAEEQMESISLRYWLDAEARMYEQSFRRFGEQGQLPNPIQFDIYWSKRQLPRWLSGYTEPGFYEHQLGPEDKHFKVAASPDGDGLYYLIFKDDADDFLDEYESQLHLLSFSLALLVSICVSALMFYLYRQLSSPLKRVVAKVPLVAPNQASFSVDSEYSELAEIEEALLEGKRQIQQYLIREQDFTRFAAHEIRTPLMTLRGSADLLGQLDPTSLPEPAVRAVKRIHSASEDIDELIKTFLVLGQDSLKTAHLEAVDISEVVMHQLTKLTPLTRSQNVEVQLNCTSTVSLRVPKEFVVVLCRNLLRNALEYSDSHVTVSLTSNQLQVVNDIDADADKQSGYGYGLIIVERICEKLMWDYRWEQSEEQFVTQIRFLKKHPCAN